MNRLKPITDGMALREARLALGLDMADFARAVGLTGSPKNLNRAIGRYERGEAPVPVKIALLAECFLAGARPSSWPR